MLSFIGVSILVARDARRIVRGSRDCDAPPPRWPREVGEVHPYESVEFPSEGAVLRGRLYRAAEASRPAVVMTHGTSATITMAIDAYAEAVFAAGYTVLLHDRHSLGRSGGEPRQRINPWVQARGYRDAVAFLRDAHGAGKIALWGDSYAAMVVLVVGALLVGGTGQDCGLHCRRAVAGVSPG